MDFDKIKGAAADAAAKAKDVASGATDSAKTAASGVGDKLSGVKDVLKDEEKTDAFLDKAADTVNKATGGKIADQVEKVRDFADDRLGDELK